MAGLRLISDETTLEGLCWTQRDAATHRSAPEEARSGYAGLKESDLTPPSCPSSVLMSSVSVTCVGGFGFGVKGSGWFGVKGLGIRGYDLVNELDLGRCDASPLLLPAGIPKPFTPNL